MMVNATFEFDGYIEYDVAIKASSSSSLNLDDVQLT